MYRKLSRHTHASSPLSSAMLRFHGHLFKVRSARPRTIPRLSLRCSLRRHTTAHRRVQAGPLPGWLHVLRGRSRVHVRPPRHAHTDIAPPVQGALLGVPKIFTSSLGISYLKKASYSTTATFASFAPLRMSALHAHGMLTRISFHGTINPPKATYTFLFCGLLTIVLETGPAGADRPPRHGRATG